MKKINKIILVMVILTLSLIIFNIRVYAAASKWVQAFDKAWHASMSGGSWSNLTDDELRILKEEGSSREYKDYVDNMGQLYINDGERPDKSVYLIGTESGEYKTAALAEIKARKDAKDQDDKNGTNISGELSGMTNEQRQEKARRMLASLMVKRAQLNIGAITTEEINNTIQEINEYGIYSGGEIPDDIRQFHTDLNRELANRNEEQDNSIYDNTENNANEPLSPKKGSKDPSETLLGKYEADEKTSPDDFINEGSDFLNTGKDNQDQVIIDGDKMQNASNMLYNILFAVGVGAALLIGSYLGIKFMMSSAEDRASIKESLLPYFAGVIIMFASFSIWKLILVLLQAIDGI